MKRENKRGFTPERILVPKHKHPQIHATIAPNRDGCDPTFLVTVRLQQEMFNLPQCLWRLETISNQLSKIITYWHKWTTKAWPWKVLTDQANGWHYGRQQSQLICNCKARERHLTYHLNPCFPYWLLSSIYNPQGCTMINPAATPILYHLTQGYEANCKVPLPSFPPYGYCQYCTGRRRDSDLPI